jgi:hypothetical protein
LTPYDQSLCGIGFLLGVLPVLAAALVARFINERENGIGTR